MLVLNNSYELGTTYLEVFLLWMLCSELVLSFASVYFVVTGHFMPFWSISILRANLASNEKSAAWSRTFIPKLVVWHSSRDIVRIKWR